MNDRWATDHSLNLFRIFQRIETATSTPNLIRCFLRLPSPYPRNHVLLALDHRVPNVYRLHTMYRLL